MPYAWYGCVYYNVLNTFSPKACVYGILNKASHKACFHLPNQVIWCMTVPLCFVVLFVKGYIMHSNIVLWVENQLEGKHAIK